MILHIPHSSTEILNKELVNKELELLRMTDHFTDELYTHKNATKVIFGLSRLICDVERFEDDEKEAMSKLGMGICYVKNSFQKLLRTVTKEEKLSIIESFYRPHHQRLSNEVDGELILKESALIIDCHSFPEVSYPFNSDFKKRRPDICLGTDMFHTPKELLHTVKRFFLEKGYEVQVNSPYSGTMVPLKHYKKDKRVKSIMIEINRRLYMDEEGFKTEHFYEIQEEISVLLSELELSN